MSASSPTLAAALSKSQFRRTTWSPLLLVLAFQSIISLAALHNTAFQDEALYLYGGRQIFDSLTGGPALTEHYARLFSGNPYLYPVLAGVLDSLGGLEAVRLMSLALMLFVTFSVYLITAQLFRRDAALVATVLFSVQGTVLFLGRLATFDALCLALLALATLLALKASIAKSPLLALLIGPVLLLAAITKYAGILFIPTVLFILFWQTLQGRGWLQAVWRVSLVLPGFLAAGLAVLIWQGDEFLSGLSYTTTNRVALIQTSGLELAGRAAWLGGILGVLAVVGLFAQGRKHLPLNLVLIGTGLLAPAYHIYKGEAVSMHKHIAFGLFFLAPLAGYAVLRLSEYGKNTPIARRWMVSLVICVVVFQIGLFQAQELYREWPNSQPMVQGLLTQLQTGKSRILTEESEVPLYYLQDKVASRQLSSLNWFEYTDKTGHYATGEVAYKAALSEGYFDLVELHFGANAKLANALKDSLGENSLYGPKPIAILPYNNRFGSGFFYIWRKR